MPVFVHLRNPERYLPGLWDFERDPAARSTWAERLRAHLADTLRHARAAEGAETTQHLERVAARWEDVIERLADLDRDPPGRTVLELVTVRDALFRGETGSASGGTDPDEPAGSIDPFARLKATSNAWALAHYSEVVRSNGLPRDGHVDAARIERGLRGMLAGNVLDVASAEVAEAARGGGAALELLAERVRERPLAVDGREAFAALLSGLRAQQAAPAVLLFVDNAGMDFVLGVLPFARELMGSGFRVALAANERAALNDVTAIEARVLVADAARADAVLAHFVEAGVLRVLSTGTSSPGIDLRSVSEAVNREPCALAVFVGQGRAVETTWLAQLSCPSVRVATLKSPLVAARLGLEAFDTIVDVREAGAPPPACNPAERGS
jgi:type II pantothenate kinase